MSKPLAFLLSCTLLLASCGGNTNPPPPQPQPTIQTPTITAEHSNLTIGSGQTLQLPLNLNYVDHVAVTGQPLGLNAEVKGNVLTLNNTAAAPGAYVLTLTATGSGGAATLRLNVTVTSGTVTPTPADFALTVTPSTLTLAAGQTGTATLTATPLNGFTGQVSYSLSSVPSGLSASLTGDVLSVTNQNAPAGTYILTVTAISAGLTHTANVSITVPSSGGNPTPTPDFSLNLTPSTLNLPAGAAGTVQASVTPSGGFNAQVTYSVSGAPAGLQAALSGSTLTVTNTSAASGTYSLTVTASGGGITRSGVVTVTVPSVSTPAGNSASVLNAAGVTSVNPSNVNQRTLTYSVVGNNIDWLDTYMAILPGELDRSVTTKALPDGRVQFDLKIIFEIGADTDPLPFNLVVRFKDKSQQQLPVTIQYAGVGGAKFRLDPSALRGPTAQEAAALDEWNKLRTSGVCNGKNYGSKQALGTNDKLNIANQNLTIQSARAGLGRQPDVNALRKSALISGYIDESYAFNFVTQGVGYETPNFEDGRAFIQMLAAKPNCGELMEDYPHAIAAVSYGQSGIGSGTGGLWSLLVEDLSR